MPDSKHPPARETWRQWLILHRHAVTMIALATLILGETLRPDTSDVSWVSDLLLSIVIMASTYDVLIRHRRFTMVLLAALPAFVMIWFIRYLDEFREGETAAGWYLTRNVLMILFLAYIIYVIGRDVFKAKRVTTDQILGGISVYLLLGLSWALAYLSVVMTDPDAIAFTSPLDELPGHRMAVLIYYSFVTMTTLGFGDILPISNLARTLTWAEAVTGQLYIAVTMAKLVGLRLVHLTESRESNRSETI